MRTLATVTPKVTHRDLTYSDLWAEFVNVSKSHPAKQTVRLDVDTATITVIDAA